MPSRYVNNNCWYTFGILSRNLQDKTCFTSAPLCPAPPETPVEGVQEYLPDVFGLEPEKGCGLDNEPVPVKCHSIFSVYVQNAYIGRYKDSGRELCNGTKGNELVDHKFNFISFSFY